MSDNDNIGLGGMKQNKNSKEIRKLDNLIKKNKVLRDHLSKVISAFMIDEGFIKDEIIRNSIFKWYRQIDSLLDRIRYYLKDHKEEVAEKGIVRE